MFKIVLIFVAYFGVFVLSGLFAFWIATRSWHWFVRAAILIVSGLPLLFVEANDLMLILLISQLSIYLGVSYEATRKSRFSQLDPIAANRLFFVPKFKLNDLMLALVTVCALLALINQATRFNFLELSHFIGIGIAVGTWSLIGVGLVYWKFPWPKKIGLGLVTMTGSLVWAALDDQWMATGLMIARGTSQRQKFVSWFLFLTTIAGLVWVMLAMYKYSSSVQETRRRKRFQILTSVLLTVAGLSFAGSTVTCYVSLLMPPEMPLGTPSKSPRITAGQRNGFDAFAQAGEEFNQSPILNTSIPFRAGKQTRLEIQKFSKSFDKVRTGSLREVQACIDWTTLKPNDDGSVVATEFMYKVQNMRSVARALSIKSRQEIHDGNYDEALSDGLLCIQLAQCLKNGILVTDLVGIACECIGSYPIQSAVKHASTSKLKDAARLLNQIHAQSPPLERVLANDQYYVWQMSRWNDRLFYRAFQATLFAPATDQFKDARARRDAIRAQLRTAIALELYKRDHGIYPARLSQLVPKYLDSIPEDPYPLDGPPESIGYFANDDHESYQLYSVGRNGIDEKGKIAPHGGWFQDGDLNFAKIVREDEIDSKKRADAQANLMGGELPGDQD